MTDLSGVAGEDYVYDPITGQWGPPGMTVNSTPQPSRIINTPNSSTGQPSFADPSTPEFQAQFPVNKGSLITTPNSRTGAPAPGIRNLPANRLTPPPVSANPMTLPIGGALGTAAAGLINAPTTDQGVYNNANAVGSAVDSNPLVAWAIQHGWLQPSPKWGPPHAGGSPTNPVAAPVPATQTQPQGVTVGGRAIPPMFGPPIPPGGLPPMQPPGPFVRGPLPVNPNMPGARAPAIQRGGGAIDPNATALAPSAPANVNLGYYRPTVGNARGQTWVPGEYGNPANPAPQIYRGPQTVAAPGGPQNYYIPGSAPMGAGNWTGVPTPPGAAPSQTGNARGGGPLSTGYNVAGMFNNLPNDIFNQGGASAPRVARAPMMQRKYPNVPFGAYTGP